MNVHGELIWCRGQSVIPKPLQDYIIKKDASSLYSTKHQPYLILYGKQLKVHLPMLTRKSCGAYSAIRLETLDGSGSVFLVNATQEHGKASRSIPVRSRSPIKTNSSHGSMRTVRTRTSYAFVSRGYSQGLARWSSFRRKPLNSRRRVKQPRTLVMPWL